MAHELATRNSMIFNMKNGLPWHGLGVGASDALNSAEAKELAPHLFAPVEKGKLFTADMVEVPGQFVTTKGGTPLGIVGNQYQILQNADALAAIDSLMSSGEVRYETIGELYGGKTFWALATIGEAYDVTGFGDEIKPYLLLSNSHTGNRAGWLQLTTIRVVCANTEGFAKSQAKANRELYRPMTFRHSGDVIGKIGDATEALGLIKSAHAEQQELYRAMAQRQLTLTDAKDMLDRIYPSAPDAKRDHAKATREHVLDLFQGLGAGSQLKGVEGTLWGLYNASTENVNHWQGANTKKSAEDYQSMKFETLFMSSAQQQLADLTEAFTLELSR